MPGYLTIRDRAEAEIEEKKSRFIAQLAPVRNEDAALAFLEEIRAKHRMARHNVYAYVLRGEGATPRMRYSDDGEPQKTAGLPTLQALEHAGLTDVVVVVTRYFGGTLLGTGGLVRAYTAATQAGIEAAQIISVTRCVDVTWRVPYPLYEQAARLAKDAGALLVDTKFDEAVTMVLRMADGEQQAMVGRAIELCRGQADIVASEPFDAPL